VAPIDATANFTFTPQNGVPLTQGAYNVTFTGTRAGIYTLNVTVLPDGLGTSTYTGPISLPCPQVYKLIQQVLPGPAYPPECWYTVSPCDKVNAGSKLDFFLQMRDQWRNPILRGGTQWAIGYYNAPGAVAVPGLPLAPNLTPTTPTTQFDKTSTLPSGWTATPYTWLTPGTAPYTGGQTVSPPPAYVSIKDFDNSSYAFSIQVYKGGFTGIVLSAVNATQWWVVIPPPNCFVSGSVANGLTPSQSTIDVVPGGPRQFLPFPPPSFLPPVTPTSFTAAIPTSFTVQARDFWGNNVTTNDHYYSVVLADISNGNGYNTRCRPTWLEWLYHFSCRVCLAWQFLT